MSETGGFVPDEAKTPKSEKWRVRSEDAKVVSLEQLKNYSDNLFRFFIGSNIECTVVGIRISHEEQRSIRINSVGSKIRYLLGGDPEFINVPKNAPTEEQRYLIYPSFLVEVNDGKGDVNRIEVPITQEDETANTNNVFTRAETDRLVELFASQKLELDEKDKNLMSRVKGIFNEDILSMNTVNELTSIAYGSYRQNE